MGWKGLVLTCLSIGWRPDGQKPRAACASHEVDGYQDTAESSGFISQLSKLNAGRIKPTKALVGDLTVICLAR